MKCADKRNAEHRCFALDNKDVCQILILPYTQEVCPFYKTMDELKEWDKQINEHQIP